MTIPDPASLQIWPQCRECILSMIQDSFSMMENGAACSERPAIAMAEKILDEAFRSGWSSPVSANKILRRTRYFSGVRDPYETFKKKELAQARRIYAQVKDFAGPDLRSRVILSVVGNSLDFFTDPEETLQSLPKILSRGVVFFHDDIDRLEAFLARKPQNVLFLTDNSGEVFFDIPLYQFIRQQAANTVLVVKGGPALNDATRVEIENEKLEPQFGKIADTGAEGVGIDWDLTSPAFEEQVRTADLIVSKGMANFETVYPRTLSAHIFFLLKAKCKAMQRYLGTPSASYCALFKEGGV